MYKVALIYFASGFVLLHTKAEPKIIILQNTNGSEAIVSSFVAALNGASFSLSCKLIPTAADRINKNHFDSRVIWKRKRKKLGFSDLDDLVQSTDSNPAAVLKFTNITYNDQGLYFCISLTYNLLEVLNLIVKPRFARKKEVRVGDFPYTYPPISQFSMRDNELYQFLYEDYFNNSTTNADDLKVHRSLLHFFYVTIGFIFVLTVVCVASRYFRKESNEVPLNSRSAQSTDRPIINRNMCSHLVCIQNRSTHPFADCIIRTNTSRMPSSNNENLRTSQLDLPPAYADSVSATSGGSVGLPPSYDDANVACNSKQSVSDVKNVSSLKPEYELPPPSYEEALSNVQTATNLNFGAASDC